MDPPSGLSPKLWRLLTKRMTDFKAFQLDSRQHALMKASWSNKCERNLTQQIGLSPKWAKLKENGTKLWVKGLLGAKQSGQQTAQRSCHRYRKLVSVGAVTFDVFVPPVNARVDFNVQLGNIWKRLENEVVRGRGFEPGNVTSLGQVVLQTLERSLFQLCHLDEVERKARRGLSQIVERRVFRFLNFGENSRLFWRANLFF